MPPPLQSLELKLLPVAPWPRTTSASPTVNGIEYLSTRLLLRSAMNSLPIESTATDVGPHRPEAPRPQAAVLAAVCPSTSSAFGCEVVGLAYTSTRLFDASATYRFPAASSAKPVGKHRLAAVGAKPPLHLLAVELG